MPAFGPDVLRHHDAEQWRSWHRRMKYFIGRVPRPKATEPYAFCAVILCPPDEVASRIDDLGTGPPSPDGHRHVEAGPGRAEVLHRRRTDLPGFTILVSGTATSIWDVSDADVEVCRELERRIDLYGWGGDISHDAVDELWWPPCVLRSSRYPDLH